MAAFAAPLIGLLTGGLSGLFGSKPKTTTTNSSSSTTPDLTGQQQFLENLIGDSAVNQYKAGAPDLSGYTANGLQNINQASALKSKTASNIVASRGLSFSPSSVQNLINPEADRLQQSSQFLSTIPLLKRQFEQQNLDQLMQSFGIMPKGSTTTGTQTQTGNTNTAGNVFSGAASGLFAALPYSSMFGGGSGSGSSTSGLSPSNYPPATGAGGDSW